MPFFLYDMTAPTDRSISATPSTNWCMCDYYNYICPVIIRTPTSRTLKVLIASKESDGVEGRSSSPVGYGIGIAEVVGSNPTRSTIINQVEYGIVLSVFLEVAVGLILHF